MSQWLQRVRPILLSSVLLWVIACGSAVENASEYDTANSSLSQEFDSPNAPIVLAGFQLVADPWAGIFNYTPLAPPSARNPLLLRDWDARYIAATTPVPVVLNYGSWNTQFFDSGSNSLYLDDPFGDVLGAPNPGACFGHDLSSQYPLGVKMRMTNFTPSSTSIIRGGIVSGTDYLVEVGDMGSLKGDTNGACRPFGIQYPGGSRFSFNIFFIADSLSSTPPTQFVKQITYTRFSYGTSLNVDIEGSFPTYDRVEVGGSSLGTPTSQTSSSIQFTINSAITEGFLNVYYAPTRFIAGGPYITQPTSVFSNLSIDAQVDLGVSSGLYWYGWNGSGSLDANGCPQGAADFEYHSNRRLSVSGTQETFYNLSFSGVNRAFYVAFDLNQSGNLNSGDIYQTIGPATVNSGQLNNLGPQSLGNTITGTCN